MTKRTILLTITAVTAILLLTAVIRQQLSNHEPIALTGLQEPRGLTPLAGGNLLIAEVGGGRLLRLSPRGELTVIQAGLPATLGGPSGSYPTGISAAVRIDRTYYYIIGEFRGRGYSTLYKLERGGVPEPLAGGLGRDGFPATRLTNPYDLVAAPDGSLLVSDGGANAVLRIGQDGTISEYATFPRRDNPAYPDDIHPQIDVVPTGLTFGPDGALYLATFSGLPYPPGAAVVYRLEDRNGDGDALDEGETAVFADGFSTATDVAFDSGGALLVTEYSHDMRALIQDFGAESAARYPGRLLRWRDGAVQVVADDLVSPTAVAVANGRIFVSEEFAGRVREIVPVAERP